MDMTADACPSCERLFVSPGGSRHKLSKNLVSNLIRDLPISSVKLSPLVRGHKTPMLSTSRATLYDPLGCHDRTQVVRIQSLRGKVPQVKPGKGGLPLPSPCFENTLYREVLLE